ncbi:hypothetical protein SADUNF_Sadunf06G0086400 [Salix dunnii]|uniref:WRKY domain-containing protein n=1 Tax=Salix dunnii TaxID=1413687 RepID=A0A835K3A5_9ROSI|nr:hypothetical protein SADUNF_Sadunf06G0086400 [Salix dunnii]
MNNSTGGDGSVFAENLVKEIMNSLTSTLSMLNGAGYDDVVSQIPATTKVCSPFRDGRKSSEDSEESSKSTAAVKVKDRRGCYKRRKSSHSWTNDTSTLTDDGHAWRKYGQKVILNAKYPRNYFRCTHKYDQHCQATKQVQRVGEEPILFRTTYLGHHTCKNLQKASQFISDPFDHYPTDSSTLLSFNSHGDHQMMTSRKGNPVLITSLPSIKQEYYKEEDSDIPSYDPTINNNQASSSDYLLSANHDHGHVSAFDHGDVVSGVNSSCTTSPHSLDFDSFMAESVGFDDAGDILGFEF